MKKAGFALVAALFLVVSAASGQKIYRWQDEKGDSHFTDDPGLIPEKYRTRTDEKSFPDTSPSHTPSAPNQPGDVRTENASDSEPNPKDLLGRDEGWWRNRVKEWKDRFVKAQKQHEISSETLKKKRRELDESKFKPDSVKRKLKAEIKILEQETMDREREKMQAKEMLERALPKEAEEYRADPAWIKIE